MLEALSCAAGASVRLPPEPAAAAASDELPEEFLEFIADWDPDDVEDELVVDEAAPDREDVPR